MVCNNLDTYHKHMKETRDYLEEKLSVGAQKSHFCNISLLSQEHFGDGVHFNGRFPGVERIPNTCNVSLIGEQLQGVCAIDQQLFSLWGSCRLESAEQFKEQHGQHRGCLSF